jgi:hypothetical protein
MEAAGWGMANAIVGRSRWTWTMMMCSSLVDWIDLKIFPDPNGLGLQSIWAKIDLGESRYVKE